MVIVRKNFGFLYLLLAVVLVLIVSFVICDTEKNCTNEQYAGVVAEKNNDVVVMICSDNDKVVLEDKFQFIDVDDIGKEVIVKAIRFKDKRSVIIKVDNVEKK